MISTQSKLHAVYGQLIQDSGEPELARRMSEEGHGSVQAGSGHYFGGGDSMQFTGNPMSMYKPSVVGFLAENGSVTAYLVHKMVGDWYDQNSIVARGPIRQQFKDREEFQHFCDTLEVEMEEPVSLDDFLNA